MVKKGNKYCEGREEIDSRLDEVGRLISSYLYGKDIPREEYFDIHQDCWLRVLGSTYDKDRGGLSNYVYMACRTTLFAYFRDKKRLKRKAPTEEELDINTDISDYNSLDINTIHRELNKQLLDDLVEEFGGNAVDIMLECITKHNGDSSKLDAGQMYFNYKVPRPEFESIIKRLKDYGAIN